MAMFYLFDLLMSILKKQVTISKCVILSPFFNMIKLIKLVIYWCYQLIKQLLIAIRLLLIANKIIVLNWPLLLLLLARLVSKALSVCLLSLFDLLIYFSFFLETNMVNAYFKWLDNLLSTLIHSILFQLTLFFRKSIFKLLCLSTLVFISRPLFDHAVPLLWSNFWWRIWFNLDKFNHETFIPFFV